MILGIGIDLIEIADFGRSLKRGGDEYRNRVFTKQEIDYCESKATPDESFTARFAAKEAALKALGLAGLEGVNWHDFEVICLTDGRPSLKLNGKAGEEARLLGLKNLQISLSHSRSAAAAVVIAEA